MYAVLRCISISFTHSDIGVREKTALSATEVSEFLVQLKNKNLAREFLLLSTCNRTELYYAGASDLKEEFIQELSRFRNDPSLLDYGKYFVSEERSEKTAERLFLVSNGVLSNILGDVQIIRQVKNAYHLACEVGTIGPCLHRLLQLVFASHKDVALRTGIHSGSASVSSVAAEISLNFIRQTEHGRVLMIGAGGFSFDVIEQLKKKRRCMDISIMNRSTDKSEKLKDEFDLTVLPFDAAADLSGYDVIISCISSSGSLVSRKNFGMDAIRRKMLIDLSVPRAFDPLLGSEPGIKLVNIDEIRESNELALKKRTESVKNVKDIIMNYSGEFIKWYQAHTHIASPVLHRFKSILEEICFQEISRHLKKHPESLDPEIMQQVSKSIVNKITRIPATQLTQSLHEDMNELNVLSNALVRLFRLTPPASMQQPEIT